MTFIVRFLKLKKWFAIDYSNVTSLHKFVSQYRSDVGINKSDERVLSYDDLDNEIIFHSREHLEGKLREISDIGEHYYLYDTEGNFKTRLWLNSKSGFSEYAKRHNLSCHDYGQGPKVKLLIRKQKGKAIPVGVISKIMLSKDKTEGEDQAQPQALLQDVSSSKI